MQQQRRIFLKVIVSSPLLGCSGTETGSFPGELGSGGSNPEGGSAPMLGGGSGTSGSNAGSSSAGNPFTFGGANTGGNPFATGGNSVSSGGTTSAGAAHGGTMSAAGAANNNPGQVVGNVSSYPVGSFQIVGGIFFLGRDAGGLFAMSMQCTHKGCAVAIAGNLLDCPCHHSKFDFQGNVLQGPATTPLPHLVVYVDAAGNVSIDRYAIVAAGTRTQA